MLKKGDIIRICLDYLPKFKESVSGLKYEAKGIFNSEMLMFVAITKYLGVNLMIESGRARGYSTKIICENFKSSQYKIKSIEFSKYNPDIRISYKRLRIYNNLELIFGNSFQIVPNLITEDCTVLIDGPKTGSPFLAYQLLNNPLVKAVFIHDTHKDSKLRTQIIQYFTSFFSTDDKDFVNKFKKIDLKCWIEQRKYRKFRNWASYQRVNQKMKSYAATLTIIFNSDKILNSISKNIKKNIYNPEKQLNFSFQNLFKIWPDRIKRIITFPIFYVYYEEFYNRKGKFELKDLIIKWLLIIKQNIKIK